MAEKDKILLEVVTPEGAVFSGMVESIVVPAEVGSTGILAGHAPLLTTLNIGVLRYVREGQEGKIAISKGFMSVQDNEAEVLVSTAEKAENIDVERAAASAERARQRLASQEKIDRARAEASLARATARLSAAGR